MKKLLMIGGGFLQTFVIKRAREMGYEVYVVDGNPNAMGYQYANHYEVIDIKDEEGCLEYAKEKNVDGVLTAATDFSVLVVSRVAEEMGLPGLHYEVAKVIKNKAAYRNILYESNADDMGYAFEVHTNEEIKNVIKHIAYPVMVKPCDGSGSRGASKVERAESFEEACRFAMKGSVTHRAIVEPFINGIEYGVETFVENGNPNVLAIMQKEMTKPPYYAELGHAFPSGLSFSVEQKVKDSVRKALAALHVNHGSVNMDLLITKNGNVHIVDIGARMGGNLIGSHIIPLGTGLDYMGNMIRAAVGDKTSWNLISKPRPIATKLLALTPGKVVSLPDFETIAEKYNVIIEHHLHIGEIIKEYHTNLDGCGYVVASGENVADALNRAATVKELIDRSIVRG